MAVTLDLVGECTARESCRPVKAGEVEVRLDVVASAELAVLDELFSGGDAVPIALGELGVDADLFGCGL